MIAYAKQADGNYAVTRDGVFIGIVGKDRNDWWASHNTTERTLTALAGSMFYRSGLRTRDAAAAALIDWRTTVDPALKQIARLGGT
jgi:hypothetical protein